MAGGGGQAGGRIVAAPAAALQIHFGPGVQVGLFLVGGSGFVAANEACGDADGSRRGGEQHHQIAAGSGFEAERDFGRMRRPGVAHLVAESFEKPAVEHGEEFERVASGSRGGRCGKLADGGRRLRRLHIRRQRRGHGFRIHRRERQHARRGNVIKRILAQGFDCKFALDAPFGQLAIEPRLHCHVAVLIQAVAAAGRHGRDIEPIGEQALRAVIPRAQPESVGFEKNRAVVEVLGRVVDLDSHGARLRTTAGSESHRRAGKP